MLSPFREYLLRPARREDAEGILLLVYALAEAEKNLATTTLQDIENLFSDPTIEVEKDTLVVQSYSSKIIGAAWVMPNAQSDKLLGLWSHAHPFAGREYPPAVLDEWLFSWVEGRALERLAEKYAGSGQRAMLIYLCWQDQTTRIAMLENHAFTPLRYFYRMVCDLKQPILQPKPIEGISIIPYQAGYSEELRSVYHESFKDEWSFQMYEPRAWEERITAREGFKPHLTFLALHQDKIIGFSINHVQCQGDTCEGYITYIGTNADWRGRGVASALLYTSLRAFKDEGLPTASLSVDTDNTTQALRLYEKHGFKPVRTMIQFAKPILID